MDKGFSHFVSTSRLDREGEEVELGKKTYRTGSSSSASSSSVARSSRASLSCYEMKKINEIFNNTRRSGESKNLEYVKLLLDAPHSRVQFRKSINALLILWISASQLIEKLSEDLHTPSHLSSIVVLLLTI